MPIVLTREELFANVWDQPMTKVAAELGISDVGLKKICDKHRVPVPGRGYWAKKAAGKKVKSKVFRRVNDPGLNRIVIRGGPDRNLPEPVQQARQTAKARERKSENKIKVSQASDDLHPTVARTIAKLEKSRVSERGLACASGPTFIEVEIAPASIERVEAYLNALVAAIEARGWQLKRGDRTQTLVVDDETIRFRIVEQVARSKHEPTEEELAAIAKWEKRRDQRRQSWEHFDYYSRPKLPEWDYTPTGHLRILLNEGVYGYDGLRRSFGDGKTQRIEGLLNSTLEALATWAAAIKTKRIEDENRRREWAEEEKRRQEVRRRQALEEKRVAALSADIERRRQQQLVLDYIAAVESALDKKTADNPEAVQEWIQWAKDYAARLDPLTLSLPRLLTEKDFSSWELS